MRSARQLPRPAGGWLCGCTTCDSCGRGWRPGSSTIGGGTGQVIATTVGATAGAVAGSNVAQRSAATVWDVSIRFDDGINRVVRVREMPNYRPGDKVRVVNGAVSLF